MGKVFLGMTLSLGQLTVAERRQLAAALSTPMIQERCDRSSDARWLHLWRPTESGLAQARIRGQGTCVPLYRNRHVARGPFLAAVLT